MSNLVGFAFAVVVAAAAGLAAVTARGLGRSARHYLQFAAALASVLAVSDLLAAHMVPVQAGAFVEAVSLIVAALVPPLLALAALAEDRRALRPAAAAAILAASCCAGLAAAVLALRPLGFAPLAISAIVLMTVAARRWHNAGRSAALMGSGAAALIAAAAAMTGGGPDGRLGFALFLCAGLLGTVVALARRSDAQFERHTAGSAQAVVIRREH